MPTRARQARACFPMRGFTLLELLVAITILALVSLIAWRALDALVRTREGLEPRVAQSRSLLAVFGQTERDLAQVAVPGWFGLNAAVSVQADARGAVLQVVRIAAAAPGAPTRLQTVFYRVEDGALLRQSSAPADRRAGESPRELSTVRLLEDVAALRVRFWSGEANAWYDPLAGGASASGGADGVRGNLPPGIELSIERTDGTVLRRVLLVG